MSGLGEAVRVLFRRGASEVGERDAGHATVAITLDLYSHATPAMHRQSRVPSTRCSERRYGVS
jgi:hypothetical protein